MSKIIHTSGKRKKAVARATLKEGTGKVKVNKIMIEDYTPRLLKLKIMEPLLIAGDTAKKVDLNVVVSGGGIAGQADAARLAIAKALVEYSKSERLKKAFLEYDRHMLIADSRQTEPSKPNDSKPRAKRQKSYR